MNARDLPQHSLDTVLSDWASGALTYSALRPVAWHLNGEPCPYADEITKRYGSCARVHELAHDDEEELTPSQKRWLRRHEAEV
jgi:hypothetical protein